MTTEAHCIRFVYLIPAAAVLTGKRIIIMSIVTIPAGKNTFGRGIMNASLKFSIYLFKLVLCIVRVIAMAVEAIPSAFKPGFQWVRKALKSFSMAIKTVETPVYRIVEDIRIDDVLFRHQPLHGYTCYRVCYGIQELAMADKAVFLVISGIEADMLCLFTRIRLQWNGTCRTD
jgi:hypothetical protein